MSHVTCLVALKVLPIPTMDLYGDGFGLTSHFPGPMGGKAQRCCRLLVPTGTAHLQRSTAQGFCWSWGQAQWHEASSGPVAGQRPQF